MGAVSEAKMGVKSTQGLRQGEKLPEANTYPLFLAHQQCLPLGEPIEQLVSKGAWESRYQGKGME